MTRWLADLLSPPACAACDVPTKSTNVVFCPACAASVERCAAGEPRAFAFFGGALATAIKRMKYAGRPDLARPLGHLLRALCRELPEVPADAVIPVPLHPCRLAERGYNQAALLAGHVAHELRLPRYASALRRVLDTPHQAGLALEPRRANVAGAFAVREPALVQGRVLLVDDVVTTGTTLAACRETLLRAGASSVTAVVVARAP